LQEEALTLRPQTQQNKLFTDPADEKPGTAKHAKVAGLGVADDLHTLPAPVAASYRRAFCMDESTLGSWGLASANWRICPTLFEPKPTGL
jgi:hypothetical protein